MNTEWAAENLLAIRTLMERSAIYRRALAPVMTFTGLVGIAAALVGASLNLNSTRAFAGFWMAVGVLAVAGDYLLVRRQALKEKEPFWSPPTRRVTQAILPAFFVGMVSGAAFAGWVGDAAFAPLLAVIWMLLYGCALHAAGFFMPRGIKVFAWVFLLAACALLAVVATSQPASPANLGHGVMGGFFGALQLAYGIYLYFTEKRKSEA